MVSKQKTARRAPVILGMLLALTGVPAESGVLDEPHLNIIPRTPEETARIRAVTSAPTDFTAPAPYEDKPAGAATVRARKTADAFSQPSGNISFKDELRFKVGNGFFRKLWVSSPSSTLGSDGLGPLFNARSCQRCHLKDGRGHPPEAGEDSAVSMFLRVSIPAPETHAMREIQGYFATLPDQVYGGQMQDFGIPGHPAEYRLEIEYADITVDLSEGGTATLRAPTYNAADLGYGPLHPDAMLSPRIAPQMIGLGLLEAIPAKDILANADPEDANGDGISGRPNIVWSPEFNQPLLGRFGLKAGAPTVRHQTAAAFAGDIGISSPLFPDGWGDCTSEQGHCRAAPHGDTDERGTEVDEETLALVTYYSRNLAVPARSDAGDPQVLAGKRVFYETGCKACHTPSFVTHRLTGQDEQSFQLIWPYSDMLLHDMGPNLADNRPEVRADGQEWRTPPLWGIGLTEQVSGHTSFLHDGRARNLLEAILWHGGEAETSRQTVIDMPKADRDALIRFLESL